MCIVKFSDSRKVKFSTAELPYVYDKFWRSVLDFILSLIHGGFEYLQALVVGGCLSDGCTPGRKMNCKLRPVKIVVSLFFSFSF